MITLAILLVIAVIALLIGVGVMIPLLDPLVAILVIGGIVKLVQLIVKAFKKK